MRIRPFSSNPGTVAFALGLLGATAVSAAPTELTPQWVARVPVGASLTAGIAGVVVDAAGVSYVTGTAGPSSDTDITTAAIRADGSLLWSRTFNGPQNGGDQARGLALGPGGVLYVAGNTPGPDAFGQVLVLAYDTASGNLLNTIQYSSAPGTAEHGQSVAVDANGAVYVAGGTVGDGGDALILAFESSGQLRWQRTWDGPAWGPFSQDTAQEVLIDPSGNPVVMIHGVMASNHPDYVVVKYAAGSGATLWQANWGVTGGDFPRDMEIDGQGDVYVTGTGIDLTDKYSTIKLRGADGGLAWQAYDTAAMDDSAAALALDGQGGVFITGRVDPDGDHSNFNDDIYTVKRDSATGTQRWTHRYGASCLWCYDVAADVIVDPAGHVFVAGSTSSPPYSADAILLVLDANTGLETARGILSGAEGEGADPKELRFDATFNLRVGGTMENFNTGSVDMSVARYASLSGGGGIECGDIVHFTAQCGNPLTVTNRITVRLALTDTSHDGQRVTIAIDGQPRVVTVMGSTARLVVRPAAPGSHTVELTDPAGCFPVLTPTCPGSARVGPVTEAESGDSRRR